MARSADLGLTMQRRRHVAMLLPVGPLAPPATSLRVLAVRMLGGRKRIKTMEPQPTEIHGRRTLRLVPRRAGPAALLPRRPETAVPDVLMLLPNSKIGVH